MDESGFERAAQLAEWERADGLSEVTRRTAATGLAECTDCGDLIPPERRAAAPFAIRCHACQCAVEAMRGRKLPAHYRSNAFPQGV